MEVTKMGCYLRIKKNLAEALASQLDVWQSVVEVDDDELKEWVFAFIENPMDFLVDVYEEERECP
jgi:hypothetical protein